MNGVLENGVFYYGARHRVAIPQPEPEPSGVQQYDADAPDIINARRYFGFTDHEEIDIFMLRSRRGMRKDNSHTQYWYEILKTEAERR